MAHGVNADGSVIVGEAEAPDSSTHLIRWVAGGAQDLGVGVGMAVSDDGSVIAGNTNVAAVWTAGTGLVSLSDFLAPYGVGIPPGWIPRHIYAVSGDGMTFCGEAVSATGAVQGFVATVPAPIGAVVLLLPALLCGRRRA
jgi:probable HAF family extracellular repeat protein